MYLYWRMSLFAPPGLSARSNRNRQNKRPLLQGLLSSPGAPRTRCRCWSGQYARQSISIQQPYDSLDNHLCILAVWQFFDNTIRGVPFGHGEHGPITILAYDRIHFPVSEPCSAPSRCAATTTRHIKTIPTYFSFKIESIKKIV